MQIYVAMDPSKVLGRLDGRQARMVQAISRWQAVAGDTVLREAQRIIAVRTGATRRSLYYQASGTVVKVGSNSVVAKWLNNGTSPHTIRPVRAQALRFQSGGRTVFAKVVHHPGTRATRFLQRALEAKRIFVVDLLRQYVLQESQLLD